MRKKIIAGNWKMNRKQGEAVDLALAVAAGCAQHADEIDVVVCPTFLSVAKVSEALKGRRIAVGAQNCYHTGQGAYTGEVNPELIADAGATYCIVGHSERRNILNETDREINLKVKALSAYGLTPIICIGETIEERKSQDTINVVTGQLVRALAGISPDDAAKAVIAYEPVWAIGTGLNATVQDAEEVCAAIRKALEFLYDGHTAGEIRVQYGGSVKPDNIAGFMACPDIDGALVGGASLKAQDFCAIVAAAASCSRKV